MVTYRGNHVMVTGGTGFIGGRLAERLVLEEGALVRVLVRSWPKATWVSRIAAELVPGDILDRNAVASSLEGVQVVFHCASGEAVTGGYRATNVEGTRILLEEAAKKNVRRFVYVSSVAVHGPLPQDGADEKAPFRRMGRDYSDSKIDAEELVMSFARERGLPVAILRPTFVWGPRSILFTVRPLVAMKRGAFVFVDEGAGDCHAVYVDNLVDALLLAGVKQEAVGEAFLVTDGASLTWKDFFAPYVDLLGIGSLPSVSSKSLSVRLGGELLEWCRKGVEKRKGTPAPFVRRATRRIMRETALALERRGSMTAWDLAKFARKGAISIEKIRRLLGYEPRFDFQTAMTETLAWVRDQMAHDLRIEGPGWTAGEETFIGASNGTHGKPHI